MATVGEGVTAVDPENKRITIRASEDDGFEFDSSLPVWENVEVTRDGIPVGLSDVPTDRRVGLEFAADKKTVVSIDVRGGPGEVYGRIARTDPSTRAVTIAVEISAPKHGRVIELTFIIPKGTAVRRAGKDVDFTELIRRMPAVVALAADRRTPTGIWVGEPGKDDDD
jgi:hypothetical protein